MIAIFAGSDVLAETTAHELMLHILGATHSTGSIPGDPGERGHKGGRHDRITLLGANDAWTA